MHTSESRRETFRVLSALAPATALPKRVFAGLGHLG